MYTRFHTLPGELNQDGQQANRQAGEQANRKAEDYALDQYEEGAH